MKNVLIIIGVLLLLSITMFTCNWVGDGANTAHKEYDPSAMLNKYEWFINHSQAILKSKQDYANLQAESNIREEYEKDNGKDHRTWSPIVSNSYLDAVKLNSQQRLAQLATLNGLIAEYNTQSFKFNWAPFKNKTDLPPTQFETIK